MKKKLAFYASSSLVLIASFVVSVASPWWTHSPEVPTELLKK
ncbi:cyclic lactone autoinducer peptide [Paenibacillus psychroresistens]|uniref:Cyclic lactone autoinducer peptide n=1 Tax=Paenibacillus psychroresistens TaxID=1778678 RepID=A0A6B8RG99_9BACL|nr:cyclic lactone autoinducer peptide [Paenibacillus psychroresistens]QGQ94967.1 cyclic lactone autoinducer peptide [Paenibacillus psychroresistens]